MEGKGAVLDTGGVLSSGLWLPLFFGRGLEEDAFCVEGGFESGGKRDGKWVGYEVVVTGRGGDCSSGADVPVRRETDAGMLLGQLVVG